MYPRKHHSFQLVERRKPDLIEAEINTIMRRMSLVKLCEPSAPAPELRKILPSFDSSDLSIVFLHYTSPGPSAYPFHHKSLSLNKIQQIFPAILQLRNRFPRIFNRVIIFPTNHKIVSILDEFEQYSLHFPFMESLLTISKFKRNLRS